MAHRFWGEALSSRLRDEVDRIAGVFKTWESAGRIRPVDARHLLITLWAATQTYADFEAHVDAVLDTKAGDKKVFLRCGQTTHRNRAARSGLGGAAGMTYIEGVMNTSAAKSMTLSATSKAAAEQIAASLKYNDAGLIPAIAPAIDHPRCADDGLDECCFRR